MKRGRVYLSGAISLNSESAKAEFAYAERICLSRGYEVFNPITDDKMEYHEYLRLDLAELLKCTHICYVNDTTTSKGAFLEKILADACKIKEIKL